MATMVGVFSERFFAAKRTSMVVEAFDQDEKKASGRKTDIAEDLIELSPLANLGMAIDSFKRESADGARMELSLSYSGASGGAGSGDPQLERDLDLMLRLIARDEKDLERLRSQFRDLFDLVRGGGSGSAPEGAQVVAGKAGSNRTVAVRTSSGQEVALPSAVVDGEVDSRKLSWTADIETIRELSISVEKVQSRLEIRAARMRKIDPLVLDLDGNGYELTEAGEGASFDIDGDGTTDRTGWVAGGDALLALDRNGNGTIDNGKELFGDQNGAANGFLELAKYDQNGDQKIDKNDNVYKALKLYRDLNGDGTIQKGEVSTLSQMGIAAIELRFIRSLGETKGNSLLLEASFRREDGTTGRIGDFQFGYRNGGRDPEGR
ncbi:MAG: hypothetical protein GX442_02150 [Candidatus Riflebacteria bacterium]|nr:hypothetical protein [Candidatus Riflebacteria bacterium]